MPGASRRVRRLEKEAILRSKVFRIKQNHTSNLLLSNRIMNIHEKSRIVFSRN